MTRRMGYVDPAPLLAEIEGTEDGPDRLGVGRRAICRWRAGGSVGIRTAEDICDRIGVHPLELWPDFYASVPGVEWDAA